MDSIYIERILNGDTSAFAYLVDKYKNMAFSVALGVVKNREDAEEVSQDSFVKAYRYLKDFRKDSKFSSWLYKIVYNTALTKIKKKKLEISDIDEDVKTNIIFTDLSKGIDLLQEENQKYFINLAIKKLTSDEQTVMTLFYLNENTLEEINDITGLTVTNIKTKLHRGRKRFHSFLHEILQEETENLL